MDKSKLLKLLLVLGVSVFIAACDNNKEDEVDTGNEETTQQQENVEGEDELQLVEHSAEVQEIVNMGIRAEDGWTPVLTITIDQKGKITEANYDYQDDDGGKLSQHEEVTEDFMLLAEAMSNYLVDHQSNEGLTDLDTIDPNNRYVDDFINVSNGLDGIIEVFVSNGLGTTSPYVQNVEVIPLEQDSELIELGEESKESTEETQEDSGE